MISEYIREEETKVKKRTIIEFIINMAQKLKEDHISAFSAQSALFIIISFFPFAMFLLTLLQYLPFTEGALMKIVTDVSPNALDAYFVSMISEAYDKASGTIMSLTVLSALWSASRAFLAIVRGFNSVYEIKESRNYLKLRIISTIYTFVFALMIIVSLGFLVFGNRIYVAITLKMPVLQELALLIISLRTVVGILILVAFFTILYVVIPNRKTTMWSQLPGAILAAVGWMGFSYLYSIYIDRMGTYSYMYGSLTAIVLLMLWLYFCMYILFVGAEFNIVLLKYKQST